MDLTNAHRDLLVPRTHTAKSGGRPRSTNMLVVVNAIVYLLSAGLTWCLPLPLDFLGRQTVYDYFQRYDAAGSLEMLDHRVSR